MLSNKVVRMWHVDVAAVEKHIKPKFAPDGKSMVSLKKSQVFWNNSINNVLRIQNGDCRTTVSIKCNISLHFESHLVGPVTAYT